MNDAVVVYGLFPTTDRAVVRVLRKPPHFIVISPIGIKKILEEIMVVSMVETWNFQVSVRHSFYTLPRCLIFLRRDPSFHFRVKILYVEPNNFTCMPVQICRLRIGFVKIYVTIKGITEKCHVYREFL